MVLWKLIKLYLYLSTLPGMLRSLSKSENERPDLVLRIFFSSLKEHMLSKTHGEGILPHPSFLKRKKGKGKGKKAL